MPFYPYHVSARFNPSLCFVIICVTKCHTLLVNSCKIQQISHLRQEAINQKKNIFIQDPLKTYLTGEALILCFNVSYKLIKLFHIK